ncbi:MAG: archaeosine synthase alpha-subunit [Methanofollis sp.]|nr:archaeosine synthase alpha-subunit [Methanofollis sp.]
MSILFDVKGRDGLARSGIVTVDGESFATPCPVEGLKVFPSLPGLTHANVPLSADQAFVDRYLVQPEGGPTLVHPLQGGGTSGGCALVANWHTTLSNPRKYVDSLISLRKNVAPDAAWYAPAAALPSNACLLACTGFDLFDFCAVDLMAARGLFCTPEGAFPADEIEAGACRCVGCETGDLHLHNRLALLAECATVRRFIARGQARELMETRCRMDANAVAVMRMIDQEYHMAELATPIVRSARLLANSSESMYRPEIRRFADRVVERYVPPRNDVAVLLPCAARKPYSASQSHQKYIAAVAGRAHEVIITSPVGVVPRELEAVYPAGHYDVPVTGYWDREECAFLSEILVRYFMAHPSGRVIAHLEGGALDVAEMAAKECGIELEHTCTGRPASPAALRSLDEALTGERAMRAGPVAGMLAWQFDEAVATKSMQVKGKPGRQAVFKGKTLLFNIDARTGMYKPTFEGWQYLNGYRVEIDNFVPHGDVLSPGVVGADPRIRPGDEVLVTGLSASATGRAMMGAAEMMRSHRGVAVKVRKVKSTGHQP